jgi:hypothetical protein
MEKEAHLPELNRYVVLNPVRARMVRGPEQWPRSSYHAMIGDSPVLRWLAVDGVLSQIGADRDGGRSET